MQSVKSQPTFRRTISPLNEIYNIISQNIELFRIYIHICAKYFSEVYTAVKRHFMRIYRGGENKRKMVIVINFRFTTGKEVIVTLGDFPYWSTMST
jgi:hypothetical protein